MVGTNFIKVTTYLIIKFFCSLGHSQVTRYSNMSQPKLVISHKYLSFSHNSLNLAWRTINSEACIYYDLLIRHACGANLQSEVVLNKTNDKSVVLQRGDLIGERNNNSAYFNITSYDEEGDQCEDQYLEEFRFSVGSELRTQIRIIYIPPFLCSYY